MFKKLLLITMVFSSDFVQTTTRRPEDFLGVVVTGIAAGCGISYWYTREPNEAKRLRALELCKAYEEKLHAVLVSIKEPKDVVHFVSQSSSLCDEQKKFASAVAQSSREIGDRYAHPLKPWNWSDDMKDVFSLIQGVHAVTQTVTIMYRYQSLLEISLQDAKPNVKQEEIVDDVLDHCKNKILYPLTVYADRIQQDIETLIADRDRSSVADGSCAYVVIGMLREVHNSIVQSDEYSEEIKHQIELGLKTHQTVVSEFQAKAKSAQNKVQRQYDEVQIRQVIKAAREEFKKFNPQAAEDAQASLAAKMPLVNELVPSGNDASQDK